MLCGGGQRSMASSSAPARAVTRCPRGGLDPQGIGTEIAIASALREAGLTPSAVGHVNAHGAGSQVADLAEARAFHRVFGPSLPPVTALKGYIGNLASGCGAVELIGSLIGVNRGFVPPAAQL